MTPITFITEPHIQALIDQGLYEYVRKKSTGQIIGVIRDKATGRFVSIAKALATQGAMVNPLFAPLQLGTSFISSGMNIYQTHWGFQKTFAMITALQKNIQILQATTAVIGVGTVAGVVLSAVNLHQTLKLREDIKQLRLEVKDGFIDLKQALQGASTEIIKHINQVAQDVEYKQHRTILAQAYGRFIQAIDCIKDALKISDLVHRNAVINNAQKILYDALADYKNPLIHDNTNIPGRLRRKECAWAIEQTLIMTYQLQGAYETVCDRIIRLQFTIRQDAIELINNCESEIELDFIFPELIRINNHDLTSLETWHKNIDWMLSLSTEEKQLLAEVEGPPEEDFQDIQKETLEAEIIIADVPEEIKLYENAKAISHFAALQDNLKFTIQPELRKDYENYVTQQALKSNRPALTPSNWEEIPNLTLANMYWYLKNAA